MNRYKREIKNLVLGLEEIYGTKDVFELLDQLDITIIKKELPKGKKAKCYRNELGDEFIYLSPSIKDYEIKFVLAHELGHLLLHKFISSIYYSNSLINKGKLEFEANYFALELLLPDKIERYEIEGFTSEQLAAIYGIPADILEIKINEIRDM